MNPEQIRKETGLYPIAPVFNQVTDALMDSVQFGTNSKRQPFSAKNTRSYAPQYLSLQPGTLQAQKGHHLVQNLHPNEPLCTRTAESLGRLGFSP